MYREQRKRTRICGQYPVVVVVAAGSVSMTTLNVSLKGALCRTTVGLDILKPGEECSVLLKLSDELELKIEGRIVRVSDSEVAIDFSEFDADVYIHLRNIIRYAVEDPDAIDEEQIVRPFED